uniref:class I SAM-dependent methyltransferase n=1 Tax=Altererythrobacter segetis TaxID=1104773 RepID=UPI00140D1092|nr:class I SAM-dependent methyltransferase [Altererythrobacter segetis]
MATLPQSARETRAQTYFSKPARYLRRNHRVKLRAELVADILGDTAGKRIIDLGCGDGSISEALHGSLTLVDSSPGMIEVARRRFGKRARYVCADLHAVEPEAHDIALCIGVLAHVDDTARTLDAAYRSLRPGGLLILQLSDHSQAVGQLNSFLVSLSGKLHYRRTTLKSVLDRCHGFELLDCRRHFLIPAGLQRLCGGAALPIERLVARTPWLADHAADAMLLLRKHHFIE